MGSADATTLADPARPRTTLVMPGSRASRLRPPLLTAAASLAGAAAVHVRDPHETGSWGFCPWLLLTGTYCPGCGSLRAVNDLTHADLAGALSSNLLFVVALPLVIALWVRSVRRAWVGVHTLRDARSELVRWGLVAAVAVAFAVLRNLPAGAWLAP